MVSVNETSDLIAIMIFDMREEYGDLFSPLRAYIDLLDNRDSFIGSGQQCRRRALERGRELRKLGNPQWSPPALVVMQRRNMPAEPFSQLLERQAGILARAGEPPAKLDIICIEIHNIAAGYRLL